MEKRRSDAGNLRDSRKQFAGVVVFGLMEDLFRVADFQESTGTHDGDARGDLRDDGKMNGERLGNDFADAHPRIRRGERILEKSFASGSARRAIFLRGA